MDPARMFTESLILGPELENGQDPSETLATRVCCDAQRGIVIGCNPRVERGT
jgi:hypothetical protein